MNSADPTDLEEQLRMKDHAIHSSMTGFAFGNLDAEITYANPAFLKMWGYEHEREVIGRKNTEFGSDPAKIHEINTAVKTDGHWRGTDIAKRRDGTCFHIDLSVAIVTNRAGEAVGVMATFVDITDRIRAEQDLRNREEQLEAILNAAVDSIVTIDRKGVIVGVNSATLSMFGFSEAELLGQNVKILMPEPYHDEHDGYLGNYLETGEARIIGIGREVAARRKDGSTFPADLAVSEVDGLGLFTGIIRDISTRRNLEREVYKASEEEKRRIASDLHDSLGSLLTGIRYLATALAQKLRQGNPSDAGLADTISEQVGEAISLTRSLSLGLHPVHEGPNELVHVLGNLARQVRSTSKLRCRFLAPDETVEFSDPISANHLFRIAQEAVNNAIRHSGATQVTLRLGRSRDHQLVLTIKDNGKGFDRAKVTDNGMGLRTMEYRARSIGAELTIQPRRKGGTVVECVLEGT